MTSTRVYPIGPIRELRHIAGMSIRQLEAATGINRGRLSIIERGVPADAAEMDSIMAAIAAGVKSAVDRAPSK